MGTPQTSLGFSSAVDLTDGPAPAEGDVIATLREFAVAVSGASDLDEILRLALLAAARMTGAQYATALLLDEEGERIAHRAALESVNLALLELVAGPMMRHGLAGAVVRERRAALVRDTAQEPRWMPGPGLENLWSAIVAPLDSGERALGVVTLGHAAAGHFDEEHLALLEIIGAQAAVAVERVRLNAISASEHGLPPSRPTFIHQPGAEVARPVAREVVALSAELRGLTALGARLSPEVFFGDVLNAFWGAMAEIIHRYGGALDSIAGDTLLAIFERAAGAAQAAVEMQAAAQRLRSGWRKHLSINAGSLDIGIAVGQAVVGRIGAEPARECVVGDVVGVAARLRELARSGEILASAEVAAAIEDEATLDLEALRPLHLRDAPPQHIFRIRATDRNTL